MKVKAIPYFKIKDISEITLLSIEEWKEARKISSVPKYTSWWWVRSPGYYSNYAAHVIDDGGIYDRSTNINNSYGCIRPAFKIPNLKSKIGSKIFVENTLCTVIGEYYALSDTVVCRHRFDKGSNNYEISEIKQFIESDKIRNML